MQQEIYRVIHFNSYNYEVGRGGGRTRHTFPPDMSFRQYFGPEEEFTHPKDSFGGVELNTNLLQKTRTI